MRVEASLAASSGYLIRTIEGSLDTYSLLYVLIVAVLIPLAGFVVSQACAALIGHFALRVCVGNVRREVDALLQTNRELQERNCRLVAVNAMIVGEHERLRRENRRLLKRALKAEIVLHGPERKGARLAGSAAGRTAASPGIRSSPAGFALATLDSEPDGMRSQSAVPGTDRLGARVAPPRQQDEQG